MNSTEKSAGDGGSSGRSVGKLQTVCWNTGWQKRVKERKAGGAACLEWKAPGG